MEDESKEEGIIKEKGQEEKDQKEKKSKSDSLPIVEVSFESQSIHNEMEELFDEDQVTHKHGSTEPEAD